MKIAEALGIDENDPMFQAGRRQRRSSRELFQKLKARRLELGLTEEQVAESMGLSVEALHRFEAADRDVRLPTIRRYALAVQADVEFVVRPWTHESADDSRDDSLTPTDHAAPLTRVCAEEGRGYDQADGTHVR